MQHGHGLIWIISYWRNWKRSDLNVSADASPEELLRRVSLLLTGLPATVEQRLRFLANPTPEEFKYLVDQQLSSPAFGERWGRHWLDLARTRIRTVWTRTFYSARRGDIATG
jgi:hypothetical protein